MTRSEKIIWIFFAATSCQLAFQHPSFLLVAGERSNLFSGLLCFLTLIVAVVFGRRDAIKLRSPEFLISVGLALTELRIILLGLMPPRGVCPATAGLRLRENLSCAPKTPIG